MTDAELIEFATDFREGILDGGPSAWMCAAVCWPLSGLLAMSGVPNRAIESDLGHMNHIWLLLDDGRALDPTADQFNARARSEGGLLAPGENEWQMKH